MSDEPEEHKVDPTRFFGGFHGAGNFHLMAHVVDLLARIADAMGMTVDELLARVLAHEDAKKGAKGEAP